PLSNHTSTSSIYTLSLHDALPIFLLILNILYHSQIHLSRQNQEAEQQLMLPDKILLFHFHNQYPSLYLHKNLPVFLLLPNFFYRDRKSTRLNSSHVSISYAVFCLK